MNARNNLNGASRLRLTAQISHTETIPSPQSN